MVLGLVVVAERGARLHGIRNQPVVDDMQPGDMRGGLDRGVGGGGVADRPVIDQIAVGFRMQLRRAGLERLRGVGDRRLLGVGDGDGLGRVARLALGLGHHDHHRVADIADPVDRQRRPGAHLHRRAVLGMDHPAADQIADAVRLELAAGQHADDARHAFRRLDVDPDDVGMRMRAAHEHCVLHAGHHHVVDIAAGAGDEALVFLARNACADAFDSHGSSPP